MHGKEHALTVEYGQYEYILFVHVYSSEEHHYL